MTENTPENAPESTEAAHSASEHATPTGKPVDDAAMFSPAAGEHTDNKSVVALVIAVVAAIVSVLGLFLPLGGDTVAQDTSTQERIDALEKQIADLTAGPAPLVLGQPVPLSSELAQAGIIDANGAVVFGQLSEGGKDVELFVDYQCPWCQKFEQELGYAAISKAVAGSGDRVRVNTLAFLKEANGDLNPAGASARAANAVMCAAAYGTPEQALEINKSIFEAADPAEPEGQFPTRQLLDMAVNAGAGEKVTTCISEEELVPVVAEVTANSFGRGIQGTPGLAVEGTLVDNPFESEDMAVIAGR